MDVDAATAAHLEVAVVRHGRIALGLAGLALAALSTATAVPARAQVIGGETSLHSINYRGVDVQELTIPFGVTWQLGRIRLDANSAYARATMAKDGKRLAELSGPTDLTARLMMGLFEDRARVIVAGNIPTGVSSLNAEQDLVATALATQLFAFPIASLGSGLGLTTAVAAAQPIGSWVVGVSGAFRTGGGYEPLVPAGDVSTLEFRPGEELRVRVALDRPVQDRWSYRLAASWSTFGWDQQNGTDFFRPGNRLVFDGMVEMPVGNGSGAFFGWHMRRDPGAVRDTLGAVLNAASARSFSGVGARINSPLSRAILLRPAVDLYVQNTVEGEGVTVADGYLVKAGVGIVFRLGGGLVFEPAAKVQYGNLDGATIRGFVVRGGFAWAR